MSVFGEYLDEWIDAMSYSYEAGALPPMSEPVASLTEGDGGLLRAITALRSVEALHEPRLYGNGSRVRRLVGKLGRDRMAYVPGLFCGRCESQYPCATVRLVSGVLQLPTREPGDTRVRR